MGIGKLAEAGALAVTAAAAVLLAPATIVWTIAAAAAMFCFQSGSDQGHGGTRER